jgi:23S rRNA pseudouridine2605 synthase
MQTRIAKFISNNGFCSRRDAEKLILDKKVTVNENLIESPVFFVNPDDVVKINGTIIAPQKEKIWIYYKPTHIITSHKDHNRKTVFDLLKNKINQHVISVGRLDFMSEGLLIITNSPKISHFFEHPKNNIQRKYIIITKNLNENDFYKYQMILENGLTVNGINYGGIDAKLIDNTYYQKLIKLQNTQYTNDIDEIYIDIYQKYIFHTQFQMIELSLKEGKNREIRNIFESFHIKILKLIRVSYGDFTLKNTLPNNIYEVSKDQVSNILKLI